MLELMKTVLKNMSHDAQYFKKEFLKAQKWLSEEEFLELKNYLNTSLGNKKPIELEEIKVRK